MNYLYILITLLLSGFFSGAEIAFLSSDKLRLELDRNRGDLTGRALNLLYRHPDQLVTTLLVGNNIVLVVYGLLMAGLLAAPLAQWIDNDAMIVVLQSVLSTIIILFTGEFLPKAIFKTNANMMMRVFALPIVAIYYLLYPLSKLFTGLSRSFIRLVDKNYVPTTVVLGRVDLDHYLAENMSGENEQNDLTTEVKIIQNALDFSGIQVRDCMIPRNEMIACELQTDIEVLKTTFIDTGLSKIIIYRQNIDDVVGYIHSSEMFRGQDWQKRINTTVFVPESMYANKLMRLLMQRKKSIAIVIDELGGTAGMVTLEDLVEEIFGDIEDEHDTRKIIAKQLGPHTYLVSGRMEIDDVNERFGLSLPESDDYLTVAGFILNSHQNIPQANEVVEIAPYTFTILRSSSTKIELVKMSIDDQSN
ncbi:hemolysin family protein [Porphyromonas gingivalis]|uniref:hemolysin family protein n=1 Tax=Porphyromonas gingivalis TaxID=837 RepID=UPI000BE76A85|nr:hemolysin family protein [Porphyromonas gingivalis]MDH7903033.1 hemolysin family protein [Porphyromonas gingivalis]PDP50576.1 hemolysin [Porphyromonas gingivalis]